MISYTLQEKKVTLAVGAAALLSTSVAFAQDDTTTKKIANTPTLEAFGESDLPKIDLGIIETATSGLQSLVEDKMTTASDGFKKVIGGDSLRDKVDGLEQVTTGLPGKLGAISATIKLGKEITDEKNSNEERLESSGKILEIVGGKLGPLGSLLTSSMELLREIAEGKDGERIAFKFLKIIIGIKTAGLSNLISNTLITMAEKVTLSPALTLDQLNSSNTTETK